MPDEPLTTRHRCLHGDARDLDGLPDASVHLVVTSPPYPLVEMWDEVFRELAPEAGQALDRGDGRAAFEAMHRELDRAWAACHRVLVEGGIACINIGDATRTVAGRFALWPNHARVLQGLAAAGFTILPDILWRKPNNSPTRFMGSGMLPPGAYVTYEHEYVLVARKGGPRRFARSDAPRRARSAIFWEERNRWFSDLWADLPGTGQEGAGGGRARSGAFPVELPWRLVHMFSLQGEVVLDPFAGTGTTLVAALAAGRSSIGVERDRSYLPLADRALQSALAEGRSRARRRLAAHAAFVAERTARGRPFKYRNAPHDVPVISRQETRLEVLEPEAPPRREASTGGWIVRHRRSPGPEPTLFG